MERLSTDKLVAYLDGEVTENEAKEIKAQLEIDGASRDSLDRLKGTQNALYNAFKTQKSADFQQNVMAQITAEKAPPPYWKGVALAGVTALAAAVVMLAILPAKEMPGTFTPRGPEDITQAHERAVGCEVYIHHASNPINRRPIRENTEVNPNDGFSFVVFNRSGQATYLMLFSVDALGRFHWFYPVTEEGKVEQSSIKVAAKPEMFPLPDGVTPGALPQGTFRIVSLFTDHPLKTGIVENAFREGGPKRLKSSFPSAAIQVTVMTALDKNQ